MLKFIFPSELCVKSNDVTFGSTAKVFNLSNDEIYKEYLSWIPLLAKYKNILFLEHILNLSILPKSTFCCPIGVVLNSKNIFGYVANAAKGNNIYDRHVSIEDMIPFDDKARLDIISISREFAMHDVNENSIFFSPYSGFNIIDTDAYEESETDNIYNNLLMFYTRIIKSRNYYYKVNDLLYEALKKGIDYCRLEVINDVLQKYLRQYSLEESDIMIRKRTIDTM